MPGTKMGHKPYAITNYRDGGKVGVKKYEKGVVVEKEYTEYEKMEALQKYLDEDTPYEEAVRRSQNMEDYEDFGTGVPIKLKNDKPEPK